MMKKVALAIAALVLSSACTGATQTEEKQTSQKTVQTQVTFDVKHVDAKGVAGHMAAVSDAVILDIRTPAEYNAGHIDGAVNIDFKAGDFKQKLAELDRNTPYLVHCRSGGRSTRSLSTFKELGFSDVTHLDGGTKGWQEAGLALTDPCTTC